jgi:malate permease and related proteins
MNANLVSVVLQLAPLFAVVVIGVLFKALGILPAEIAPLLSRLVMTLTLPALVFSSIHRAGMAHIPFSLEYLKVPLVAYVVMAACGLLAWQAGKRLALARAQRGALILAAMLGSTAFLGYPIIITLTDAHQLPGNAPLVHALYSEIGTLVVLVTIGLMIASVFGEGAAFTWRNLLAVPRAAPFIALILALLFYDDPLPDALTKTVDFIGQTSSFLMMLYLGISIVGTGVLAYWRPILASQGLKLIFAPLLAFGLGFLLQMSADLREVSVIDSATPSILLCLAYAAQYKLDLHLATALVFSSFVFSVLTLAVWLAIVVH